MMIVRIASNYRVARLRGAMTLVTGFAWRPSHPRRFSS